jgi:hypothetical protein
MLSTVVNGWVITEMQKSLPKSASKTTVNTLAEEEDTHAKIVFIGQITDSSRSFDKDLVLMIISV